MNGQQTDAGQLLDDMLPEGLKPSSVLLAKADRSEEAGTSAEVSEPVSSQPHTEASTMQTAQTQAVAGLSAPSLTAEQIELIKTTASQQAAALIADKNREAAVASEIAKLATAAETAKAQATAVQSELTKANEALTAAKASIKTLEGEVENQKVEAAKQKKAAEDATKEKDDYASKFKKAKADLDVAAVKSKVAERKAALATANIKAETKFAAKAVATTEDGTALKMSDEDFNDGVEDLKQVAPAQTEQAAANETNKTGEQAAQTGEQTQTQATASTAAPAAPDLSNVGMYRQATAALANGAPTPSKSGVSKYSQAFGV